MSRDLYIFLRTSPTANCCRRLTSSGRSEVEDPPPTRCLAVSAPSKPKSAILDRTHVRRTQPAWVKFGFFKDPKTFDLERFVQTLECANHPPRLQMELHGRAGGRGGFGAAFGNTEGEFLGWG